MSFTALGYLGGLVLELPSGYISDTIGHKKTLLLSRASMIISMLLFLIGGGLLQEYGFWFFVGGAIFMNVGFAFNSGTLGAYFYELLEVRGDQENFTQKFSRIRGSVSLVAVFFLILLPFTIKIHVLFPFVFNILFDILGVWALLKLPNPRDSKKIIQGESQGFFSIIKDFHALRFLPFAFFIGITGGIMHGKHSFDTVYLESIGLPIVFIGALMGLSRVFWFLFSRRVHMLEEYFSMRQILLGEVALFSLGLLIVAMSQNFYIVLLLLAMMTGAQHGLSAIHTRYEYTKYLKNPKYKATISSFTNQIINILAIILAFTLGITIDIHGYRISYILLAVLMFAGLSLSYYYIFRKK